MISNVLRVVVCSSSFVYTFYTLCTFTGFLSKPIDIAKNDELKNGKFYKIVIAILRISNFHQFCFGYL